MRILVIGCGSIGRRHLANLHRLDAAELFACDTEANALAAVSASWPATCVTRVEQALEHRPDAVLVCTPTDEHLPIARLALEAGAHVFIEKPLSVSLEGTDDLLALARTRSRTVLVACNMRFHPGVAQLKAAIEQGAVRKPSYFRSRFSHYLPNWRPGRDYRSTYSAQRARGGGVVLEGVHEIDYLRWIGGEIVEVSGTVERLSDLVIDVEDTALLLARFASGALAEVHLDCLSPLKLRGCEVVGADGVLRWSSVGKAPEVVRVEWFDAASGRQESLYESDNYDANEMYIAEMRHFLDCVRGGTPLLDLEAGTRVLNLALVARDGSGTQSGALTSTLGEPCDGRVMEEPHRSNMHHPFLGAESISLRPLELSDLDGPYLDWLNDHEITRYLETGVFPSTRASLQQYIETVARSPDNVMLAIVDRETGIHVGNVKLGPIHWLHRRADLGILVGDRRFQGRGVGQQAVRLMLEYGFTRLNLHKITLGVHADHHVATRLYKKMGFAIEGRLREELFRDGSYQDKHVMGIMRSDWESRHRDKTTT